MLEIFPMSAVLAFELPIFSWWLFVEITPKSSIPVIPGTAEQSVRDDDNNNIFPF